MALANSAKHAMLDHLGTLAVFASLHSAAPGTTGANEITGGTPAYARKGVTYAAAANGAKATNASVVFDVPASTTITHVGLWSALTVGTFYGFFDIVDEVYAGQGTYTLTSGTLTLT